MPLALAAGLMLSASGPAEARHGSGPGGQGLLRAFHNSPDTPAVDIWVDGEVVLQKVAYGDMSDYLALPTGDHVIEVKVFPSLANDPPALAATVAVGRKPITLAAIGSLSGQGGGLQAKLYSDGPRPWLGFFSRLRVAHTSPDAPPVDVQVKLFGDWITVIPSLAFGESAGYLPLPALRYDFRVVVAGTETVALDLPGTQLPGGAAVTVWAVNFVSEIAPFVSVDGR
jgi:hypothetical protein